MAFATTRWSMVLAAAGRRGSPEADQALAELCRIYWYPLYGHARSLGKSRDGAEDLVQSFFLRLLDGDQLAHVDRRRGRFRSFLSASFNNFLSNERDREQAKKRGGGWKRVAFNAEVGERRFSLEPAHELTPQRLFERRWALSMLDEVLVKLREEYRRSGREELFDALKPHLTGDDDAANYRSTAEKLATSEGAVRTAVHRLRKNFRKRLRGEIRQTVDSEEEVDEEIRDLFAALRD
jgi:RNA polymerase sigma-70 factor (ECF subfamily)